MKKIKVFIFLLMLTSLNAAGDYWTQMATFPGFGTSHPFSFSIGSRGYVGCGDSQIDDVWEYDVSSNTWTQKADFGSGACFGGVGFSINGKGYVATGSSTDELWEYNPQFNNWTQKTSLPAGGSYRSAGFAIGDNGYVGGGSSLSNDFWGWNQPTNSWSQKSDLPDVLHSSVGFTIGGKGYFCTGASPDPHFLWEYDPITDSWTQRASFPGDPRIDAAGFALCGKGYICLGGEAPYYNDTWQYDPQTNQWLQKAFFPGNARDDAAFFTIGNKGYAGLGEYNNGVNYYDFWEYTSDSICDQLPEALFYGPNTTCPGTCVSFSNFSLGSTSNTWFFPGSTTATSSDINPSNICYLNPGSYDVALIVSNALGSDTLIMQNYITVYPTPPPQSIIQQGDTLFAIAGAVTYQWYYNGSSINGATNYLYVALSSGDYNIVATDMNGCEVEAALFNVLAGVQSVIEIGQLKLFPNPAGEIITIEDNELIKGGKLKISIFNSLGEKVRSENIINYYSYSQSLQISVAELHAGTYILELLIDDRRYQKTFVKK